MIDQAPRARPEPVQLEQLKSLAALACTLFTLKDDTRKGKIARAALLREEKRHPLALEAATIASWVWHVASDTIECDPLLAVLFRYRIPLASRRKTFTGPSIAAT